MSELLMQLAEKLNISTRYNYFYGGKTVECTASDDLLKYMIKDMGYKADSNEDILKSLDRLEKVRWQKALEAVYVCIENDVKFDIVLKHNEAEDNLEIFCAKEGEKKFFKVNADFKVGFTKNVGRAEYVMLEGNIIDHLDCGYYTLRVKTKAGCYETILAVAPQKCYQLDKKGKEKLFGFALQLYSLKSKRNWGVGDFTDLMNMVDILAKRGGDVIGLNPLNVLLNDYPECASPYASVSRLFLNPIYIDVEKVPSYEKGDVNEQDLNRARESEHIDYTTVYNLKIGVLRKIFDRIRADEDSAYYKEFEAFKADDNGDLQLLASFQAIEHERFIKGEKFGKKEKDELISSMGRGVEKFVKNHHDEIEFFKYLQFEADRQLRLVEQEIKKKKMIIGLYRDLPVGVSKDSAEMWSDRYLYVQKSGAGAPPDNYFPTGQKWGLAAFNPFELKERGYRPFIKILRANMRYAGAVRIDHIMGLARLFVIPDAGKEGTYIRYNAQDMMNILALESHLNKCAVVGECIGNVEPGYSESLLDRGIYLLGVLWSERKDANGTMKKPDEYERKYFASVGTHDMPPLRAWWFGREIALMNKLGLYNNQETGSAYHWREHERRLLLSALDTEGVWPEDKKRQGDYIFGESYPEGIDEAVHAFMAKTNSEVFMLMPEDVFQSEKIQNLPGTDIDKYPNWRMKQVIDIEDIENSEAFRRHIEIVKKWR